MINCSPAIASVFHNRDRARDNPADDAFSLLRATKDRSCMLKPHCPDDFLI